MNAAVIKFIKIMGMFVKTSICKKSWKNFKRDEAFKP